MSAKIHNHKMILHQCLLENNHNIFVIDCFSSSVLGIEELAYFNKSFIN